MNKATVYKIKRLSLHQPIKYPTGSTYTLKHDIIPESDNCVITYCKQDYYITLPDDTKMLVHATNVRSSVLAD